MHAGRNSVKPGFGFTRVLIILLGISLAGPSFSQADLSQFLSSSAIYQMDLADYAKPTFQWPASGRMQATLNDGLTQLEEGNINQAVSLFEQTIQQDSTFWPAHYYHGVSLALKGSLDSAQQPLLKLVQKKTDIPEVYLQLGKVYYAQGKLTKARDAYQGSLKINKSFAMGHYALGTVFAVSGDVGKARRSFERCIELDPGTAEAYLGLALIKFGGSKKLKDVDLTLFNKALEADSTFRAGLFWRGLIQAEKGKYDACLTDWNRLLQYSPNNPFLLNMRGYLYIVMERYDDAFPDFRKAVMFQRRDDSRYLTGQTAIDQWVDLQNALDYLNRTGYGLQENAFRFIKKGVCLMLIGDIDGGLTSLNEASRVQPSAPAYLMKAILFDKKKMDDSAQSNYVKTLALDNDVFDAHKKRALFFFGQNDWRSTYRELNDMRRINPEADVTFRISGMLKSSFRDYPGCVIDLSRVLKKDTTDVQAWRTRAFCRSNIGDYKGGLEDAMKALILDPENRSTQLLILDIQLAKGDSLSALNSLRKLSEKDPTDCAIKLRISDILLQQKEYGPSMFMAELVIKSLENRECANQWFLYVDFKSHALFNAALVFQQYKKPDLALQKLNESLSTKMVHDRLFRRFLLLVQLDRIPEAKNDLRVLREVNYDPAKPYFEKYLN